MQKAGHVARQVSRTMVPLCVAGFIAYGYNNVFMTLTPTFAQFIGADIAQAGLQGTVFLLTAVILRFIFGPLADRVGPKPVMAAGVASFAVSAALFVLCDTMWQVLCVRIIQAVGLAAFFPCATSLVATTAPHGKAGFYLGLYRFVTSASLLCGPTAAFAIAQAAGYRACFALMGALALAALALIASLPARSGHIDAQAPQPARQGIVAALLSCIAQDRSLAALVLGVTVIAALGYGLLMSFAASYVLAIDPAINAGTYFTLVGLGGLAINPLAGWLSDHAGRTGLLATWLACLGAGIAVLGLFDAAGTPALAISGLLAGSGYAGAITTVLSVASARCAERSRTSLLALQQNAIDLGIACASGVFGLVLGTAGNAGIVFVGWGVATVVAATALVGLGMLGRMRAKRARKS